MILLTRRPHLVSILWTRGFWIHIRSVFQATFTELQCSWTNMANVRCSDACASGDQRLCSEDLLWRPYAISPAVPLLEEVHTSSSQAAGTPSLYRPTDHFTRIRSKLGGVSSRWRCRDRLKLQREGYGRSGLKPDVRWSLRPKVNKDGRVRKKELIGKNRDHVNLITCELYVCIALS